MEKRRKMHAIYDATESILTDRLSSDYYMYLGLKLIILQVL